MPRVLATGRALSTGRAVPTISSVSSYLRSFQLPAPPALTLDPVALFGASLSYLFHAASANVIRDAGYNISQWSDTSGLARHLTSGGPSSTGKCRWIEYNQSFNGHPTVRFPGPVVGGPNLDSGTAWTAIPQPRTTVTVFASNDRANTGYIYTTKTADNGIYHESGGKIRIHNGTDFQTNWGGPLAGIASVTGFVTPSNDVHVIVIEENGASSKIWIDGVLKDTGNAGSTSRATLRLGGRFTGTGSCLVGDIAYHFAINRAMTAEELAAVTSALLTAYVPGLIVCDGDSLTLGRQSTLSDQPSPGAILNAYPNSYPAALLNRGLIKKPFQLRNFGVGGQAVQTMRANGATTIDPLYSAARPFNICILWGGANDFAGRSAAQIYGDIAAYAVARAAAGFQVVVRTSPWLVIVAGQQVRIDTNALIMANASGAPYIVDDVGSDGKFQFADPTYYNADATHFNDLGYYVHGCRVAIPVNSLIP